jgi:hypothetical protein
LAKLSQYEEAEPIVVEAGVPPDEGVPACVTGTTNKAARNERKVIL